MATKAAMSSKAKSWMGAGLAFMIFSGVVSMASQVVVFNRLETRIHERAEARAEQRAEFEDLQSAAEQASEKAPYSVGQDIQFTGAQARLRGGQLFYVSRFELTNYASTDLTDEERAQLKRDIRPVLLKQACSDDDVASLFDKGVFLVFEYAGKDAKPVMSFVIRKADCDAALLGDGAPDSSSAASSPTGAQPGSGSNAPARRGLRTARISAGV